MENITVNGSEVEKIIIEVLPAILKEKFKSSYSNPIATIVDEELKKVDGEIRIFIRGILAEVVTNPEFKAKIANEMITMLVQKGLK